MSSTFERFNDTETPWEFLPLDGERMPTPEPAEEAAIHVASAGIDWRDIPTPRVVVHYLDDEEPEARDRSVRAALNDVTPACDEPLVRQHYIEPPIG